MDSEMIEERTESAVEHTEDLLEDAGSEGEDKIDEHLADEIENCTKEEHYDDQDYEKEVDDEGEEETNSDKDGNGNKSSKGMFKTAKKFVSDAVGLFGSKFNFNINFNIGNLASSKKKDQQEGDPIAGTSRKTGDKEGEENAKRITSLVKDKKLLNEKLSKMQEQLSASQAENNRLKTELQNMQKQDQQGSTISLESQREKHRNEVKRLESELNTATESLEKMKLTNQKQMEESCRLRKELESISKSKDDMIKELEQKVASYRLKLDKLNNVKPN